MKENMKSASANNKIIRELIECTFACEICYSASLQEGDVNMMSLCIELNRDCSEICMLGAKLLQRDSEISPSFLVLCEEVCRKCAEECHKHAHDHCKACAEACDRCAEVCHEHHENLAIK